MKNLRNQFKGSLLSREQMKVINGGSGYYCSGGAGWYALILYNGNVAGCYPSQGACEAGKAQVIGPGAPPSAGSCVADYNSSGSCYRC